MQMGPSNQAIPSITVFSKPDCPLCDELKDELCRRHIEFVEQTIISSEEWFLRYQYRVPVVVGQDGREFDPPFSEQDYRLWTGKSG